MTQADCSMAYDDTLAVRIREILAARTPFEEIAMFGGLCFTVGGNMCVGVVGDDLMARVGPDAYEAALGRPGAREMDFTKRPMKGYVFVGGDGTGRERELASWIDLALGFVQTLPPKRGRRAARA